VREAGKPNGSADAECVSIRSQEMMSLHGKGGPAAVLTAMTEQSHNTSRSVCLCSMPVLVSMSMSGGSVLQCQTCGSVTITLPESCSVSHTNGMNPQ
jgi:hypothetical protein